MIVRAAARFGVGLPALGWRGGPGAGCGHSHVRRLRRPRGRGDGSGGGGGIRGERGRWDWWAPACGWARRMDRHVGRRSGCGRNGHGPDKDQREWQEERTTDEGAADARRPRRGLPGGGRKSNVWIRAVVPPAGSSARKNAGEVAAAGVCYGPDGKECVLARAASRRGSQHTAPLPRLGLPHEQIGQGAARGRSQHRSRPAARKQCGTRAGLSRKFEIEMCVHRNSRARPPGQHRTSILPLRPAPGYRTCVAS